MSVEQDRVLAQLSVDAGLLTRDEASHYWHRVQAPGAPRFVQLLVQEGRLKPAQLEELKARYYAVQQGLDSGQTVVDKEGNNTYLELGGPASPTELGGGASDSFLEAGSAAYNMPTQGIETTMASFLGGMSAKVPGAPGGPDPWEEALHKDMLLAQVLLKQGVTTHDRLRECRDLQLQHKMRLGVILVKKGYVERGVVEAAIKMIRTQISPSGAGPVTPSGVGPVPGGGPPQRFQNASTHLDGPLPMSPFPPGHDPDEEGTVLDGPRKRRGMGGQDGVDTVLNTPSGGVNLLGGLPKSFDPFNTGPSTGLSMEELNPFANVPLETGSQSWKKESEKPVASHGGIPLPDSGGEHVPAAGPPKNSRPVVDMPAAGMGSRPTSGFTTSGVPIGGEADSGSTKMKAREKAQLQRVKHKKGTRRKQSNFPLLLILMVVGGLAIAVGIYFLISELDF